MACDDAKQRTFLKVPVDSTYELFVTGPAGFAARADFDDGDTGKLEAWNFGEISPGPKIKPLTGSGKIHVVFIFVNIDETMNIEVEVKASIGGKPYCRTVRLHPDAPREIIVHTIRMA